MLHINLSAFVFCFCLAATALLVQGSTENERKTYIVYMGEMPDDHAARISVMGEHDNLLLKTVGDESMARDLKIHSYGKSINAFAARLLPDEAKRLSDEEGVVSVFENTRRKLLTTRSWDFLGMREKLTRRNQNGESNIIVGLMDTGIWPDSPSFNGDCHGPPPAKWKGKCEKGANFTGCNNKVIGARYYQLDTSFPIMDEPTPVDTDGHGTHTASTAAGNAVKGSLYGIGRGTARGGVPSARIAMYKVCWGGGCSDLDILAAFDDAIPDGVDIISISIGGPSRQFFHDPIAIGAFHAMRKGILTSCAGGNDGPMISTVQNNAPWIMTVAASSIDRQFISKIRLGDGTTTWGNGINTFTMKNKIYPLTSGAHASNLTKNYPYGNASACDFGTLGEAKVKGRIVYCLGDSGPDSTIKGLKGAGTIMAVDPQLDYYMITLTPGATVARYKDGDKIDRYINSTKMPRAVIYKTITVRMKAPFVASFSSRGPQFVSRSILKPDLAAPGLNILASYTKLTSLTGDPSDRRFSDFTIMSGTSMACPHASGAAAYVKSFHPDWSPAAIKSALMTTATPMRIRDQYGELSSGSGQINPLRAVHPGLIYDIDESSYVSFLCKEGYNSTSIGILMGDKKKYKCSDFKKARGFDGLNYPSMHIQLGRKDTKISAVFYRTVTYVGYGNISGFKAKVTSPKELSVVVIPNMLRFTKKHQKQSFKVFVKGKSVKNGTDILSATLEWINFGYSVKSPILVYKQGAFF